MIISDLQQLAQYCNEPAAAGQLFILTDDNVARYCLSDRHFLTQHIPTLTIPTGEQHKNLTTVQTIWDFLFAHNATRQALLLNIGGGVISDLGGFAAATYKRGIRFINLPTTLLSMVDAAFGGKTGCNYHNIKNAIGTFTQPYQTLIYPPFLNTLPAHEWLSGFAEMLKYALIADPKLWQLLINYDIANPEATSITPLLQQCLCIKQHIVQNDPLEQGLRHTLNFGHTVGHAIEETYTQQNLTTRHGYCVLYGMIAELYLSVVCLDCPRTPLQQLTQLMLQYYGRPTCNCRQQSELLTLMRQDKKNDTPNQINFTLLRNIGEPLINQTPPESLINEGLDYLFSI